ncbi:MAG: zinc metallopeptidase [Sedimenticola sp.]
MPLALIILLLLLLLLVAPQWWVNRVMARHNQKAEDNFPGSGGELARHLLQRFELEGVKVEATDQGDHYDPLTKTVRLTPDKLEGRTLTAISTAAHEVGHALQDAMNEPLFRWRTRLAIAVGVGQKVGSFLLFAAPFLSLASRTPLVGLISVVAAFMVMGLGLVVQLVTLPVEWDASFNKALPLLKDGYLEEHQIRPTERILRAAALTYVAGSLAGLLNFWRWMQVLRR